MATTGNTGNTEKKEFNSLDANALVLAICSKHKELIIPDAPIAKTDIGGVEFKKLIDIMGDEALIKVHKTLVFDKGLNQSTSIKRMKIEYIKEFAPFFKSVTVGKSLESLTHDIGVAFFSWWLPLNPTKKMGNSANIKMLGITELIARKTKADTVVNLINKVGGTYQYRLKDYKDMDILETIKTEVEKVLK